MHQVRWPSSNVSGITESCAPNAAARIMKTPKLRKPRRKHPTQPASPARAWASRVAFNAASARDLLAQCERMPVDLLQAVTELVGQLAFEKSVKSSRGRSSKELIPMVRLFLACRDRELKVVSLEQSRERNQFKAAQATMRSFHKLRQVMAQTTLDDETKLERTRQILFGPPT